MLSRMDPKVDFVFKRIFGSKGHEDILMSLINAVLKLPEEKEIKEVEILNPYIDKDAMDDKYSILDLRARTKEGIEINIEVQLLNQYDIEKRTLYYWAKMYEGQMDEGSRYIDLKKTITINIINFSYLKEIDKYHSVFHIREDKTGKLLTDVLEIHFIELVKLSEEIVEDKLVKWMLFLRNLSEEKMEEIVMGEPAIKKAMTVLEFLSQDKEARMQYEMREKVLRDEVSRIEGAKEKGKIEGKLEGKMEGKMEGKLEVAKALLEMGVDISTVVKSTGLSEEEIGKLKD